jgi:AcrR family transcriptional regulator
MVGHERRADARENRRTLLDAVSRLLRTGVPFTLTELAAEAQVSRATTYRNFSSPDAAVQAYIHDFLDAFEDRCAADPATQRAGALAAVSRVWTELIAERSHALAHARSAEGFLARVRADDPIIGRVYRVVRPAVDRDIAAGTLKASDPDLVVFLWNLLLDPRELIDLAEHRGAPIEQVGEELLRVVYAAAVPDLGAAS